MTPLPLSFPCIGTWGVGEKLGELSASEASSCVSLSDRIPVPTAKRRDIKHPVQKKSSSSLPLMVEEQGFVRDRFWPEPSSTDWGYWQQYQSCTSQPDQAASSQGSGGILNIPNSRILAQEEEVSLRAKPPEFTPVNKTQNCSSQSPSCLQLCHVRVSWRKTRKWNWCFCGSFKSEERNSSGSRVCALQAKCSGQWQQVINNYFWGDFSKIGKTFPHI